MERESLMWWSWVLTAIGLTGLWLVTRKDQRGFLVGVAVQALWIAYAVVTHQWGFIVSALAYGVLNARGWAKWQKDRNELRQSFDATPFSRRACGCKHIAADHEDGGWGECKYCGCTYGVY